MAVITYRLEVALKVPGERILPEVDVFRELCLDNLECLGSDVDALEAKAVCKVDKGKGNKIAIETLRGNMSVTHGSRANPAGMSYRRNSS